MKSLWKKTVNMINTSLELRAAVELVCLVRGWSGLYANQLVIARQNVVRSTPLQYNHYFILSFFLPIILHLSTLPQSVPTPYVS